MTLPLREQQPWAIDFIKRATPEQRQKMSKLGTSERELLKQKIKEHDYCMEGIYLPDAKVELIADACLAEFDSIKRNSMLRRR